MEHGEEESAFNGEIEVALGEQVIQNSLAAGFTPETFEDKGRPNAASADGGGIAFPMRGKEQDVFGKTCARGEEAIELPIFAEAVKPSEGDEDALAGGTLLS